eukprot:TRINITY_DN1872_c0_g1_i1.p1 TRINITY_DN1872_c0_g1~~TRINITY_DN1872_c0_g1_i1.p1  ORF type:complete len:149 (+),score=22.04 TRINITY_DN1872_c0_g1_i1:66-512(+)
MHWTLRVALLVCLVSFTEACWGWKDWEEFEDSCNHHRCQNICHLQKCKRREACHWLTESSRYQYSTCYSACPPTLVLGLQDESGQLQAQTSTEYVPTTDYRGSIFAGLIGVVLVVGALLAFNKYRKSSKADEEPQMESQLELEAHLVE